MFCLCLVYVVVEIQMCRNSTIGATGEVVPLIQDSPLCEWNITASSGFFVLLTFEYLDASPQSNYNGLHVSILERSVLLIMC